MFFFITEQQSSVQPLRRSARQRAHQQQRQQPEKQVLYELKEFRENLDRQAKGQESLEEENLNLRVGFFKLREEVRDMQVQLQQLRNLQDLLDEALLWGMHGPPAIGQHVFEQQAE